MLKSLFFPKSVALIGASQQPKKLGFEILSNLVKGGFKGDIFPVNPNAQNILDLKAYPSLQAILDSGAKVDLAVIAIPAKAVLECLDLCAQGGVKAAIIISAGFRETGHEGLKIEQKIAELADRYGMSVVGPNCLGVMVPSSHLNASFAADMPLQGDVAFMSQSGALCTSVLDMSLALGLGFSRFVSLGNKAHLNELDFLQEWENDADSKVIMAYLEGIADGTKFIEKARKITKIKPIIAIKSGSTNAGSRAVSSHTGTLAGSEQAYQAAFKQAGIIRAHSIKHIFDLIIAFAWQPVPEGNRVAVVTNAGGPGIMATDAIERLGLRVASLSNQTMEQLRQALPAAASVLNPVDVLGDALADRYEAALEIVAKDPDVDAILTILTPQIMTEAEKTAEAVIKTATASGKPMVTSFIGSERVKAAHDLLMSNHVPNYQSPELGVSVLRSMYDQSVWRKEPLPLIESFAIDKARIREVFSRVRQDKRLEIGESEAREVLEALDIPIPLSKLCKTPDEAADFAERIGFPVVMKIASPDILHKTDIGGVRLGISGRQEVRDTFDLITLRTQRFMPEADIWGCMVQKQVQGSAEVILGMNRDPQFGPLVMLGLGGIFVEVLKDVSFRIAPFSKVEAEAMVSELRSAAILYGVRGRKKLAISGIVETLLKISQLVTEFPEIVELDINPLTVFEDGKGVMGIDMRLVLSSHN